MRVLVVGQGAREHALCWKLKQSPLVHELYAAPGNAGIASVADCVQIGVADIVELADFAEKLKMDLTVVGPELPLTLGIVDEFQKRGLAIFGPTRLAAELEGSKVFSKDFMRKYDIPTAAAWTCNSVDEAKAALKQTKYPAVLKVDGLAAGKGVVIVESAREADEYLHMVFEEKKFGTAATRILVEEFLAGEEVSFIVVTDGKKALPLAPVKDYKKAFDGDTGPNTGGMGAHSPAVVLGASTAADIMSSVILPTLQGMEAEGRPYTGVLYAGLMLTANGPRVLEYNCRFGDPETQVQMLRLDDDLAEVCLRVARGNLGDLKALNFRKEAAACVVIAVDGYPDDFPKGQEVEFDPIADDSVVVFHAGVVKRGGKLVNQAGRVVSVCARAASLSEALAKVYEAAPKVRFEGARYRRDIGYRALEARKSGAWAVD
ncbi:MAG: phosphoribosylamine--glycine ligase [Acidobacteria bacterium]|nr:phosphoribosylamine--glycine ligase [Acidobacteriota bacterium]MBV9477325.1 phosphoribosylamine--glycine ligase [Acidobacteriota bacterium]